MKSARLEQTLAYEHVSMPINSAVQVMLQRAATELGKTRVHRLIVSSIEAALGVVHTNLAISVLPQEVAQPYAASHDLCVIALDEPWALRHFAICFRDEASLSSATHLLLTHLQAQGTATV